LIVDYDDFLKNPESRIDAIIQHLELSVSGENRQAAISNIDPSLYRSVPQAEWVPIHKKSGELAEALYLAIRTGNTTIFSRMITHRKETALESVQWVDTEIGIPVTPSLFRSLQSNSRGVKDKILKMYAKRKPQSSCPNYSVSAEEHTIIRPEDLGDLVRKKVHCTIKPTDVTIEECFSCWKQKEL
jgi:hypothetical protein